jgi:hypothetical protein
MTTSKGLGISIKYGDHSREMELRVNQHTLGVRMPQGDAGGLDEFSPSEIPGVCMAPTVT